MAEIFTDCQEKLDDDKPALLSLSETHIDTDEVIPISFRNHFYASTDKTCKYSLQAFLWALIIQRIFPIPTDQLLLVFLAYSKPLRGFYGFDKVPDTSRIIRFKQDFLDDLQSVFEHLVDPTEPVCQAVGSAKADMIIFDSSGVEAFVIENDPRYVNRTIKQLKAYAKSRGYDKSYDPYKAVCGAMPSHASADPEIKQLYISGHLCYVFKFGTVANGFKIIRRISFYNKDFIVPHPDIIIEKKTDSPDEDKFVRGPKLLVPVLEDLFAKHPLINPKIFLGNAAFDSVQLYKELLSGDTLGIDEHFSKAYIPLNSCSHLENMDHTINDNGISCRPHDPSLPMKPEGDTSHPCCGLSTFGFVHLKMKYIKCGDGKYHRRCQRDNPCITSPRERMIYTYPEKGPHALPGTIRDTREWDSIHEIRTVTEQDINHIKANLCLAGHHVQSENTLHIDLILTDIAQLMAVVLTDKIKHHEYIRSLKSLTAQDLPISQLDEVYLLYP